MPGFWQVALCCEKNMERWKRENQAVEIWPFEFEVITARERAANSAWLEMPCQCQISWMILPALAMRIVSFWCCQVIVFCQSVNTAHRLARLLQICCALRKVGEEAEEEAKTEDELLQETGQHVKDVQIILNLRTTLNLSAEATKTSSLALIHCFDHILLLLWRMKILLSSGFSLGQSEATVATGAIQKGSHKFLTSAW